MARPVRLFISYAREDEAFLKELDKTLTPLKREGLVQPWHDRCLIAGEESKERTITELQQADLIVLLVSRDFIHSSDCFEVEMRHAIEKHKVGSAQVVPIILKACEWQHSALGALQPLPKSSKPIKSWRDKDKAWLDVCQGLRVAIDAFSLKVSTESASPNQLVALGPNVIVPGTVEGTHGSRWSIRLEEPFTMGSLLELTRFGREFISMDVLDRYLPIESYGEGYTLAEPPHWKKSGNTILMDVVTEPMTTRTKIQDLNQDVAMKRNDNGKYSFLVRDCDVVRVGGEERVGQLLRKAFTYVLGSWKANRRLGSRVAEFYGKFGLCPVFEHLISLELIRMAFAPEEIAMTFINRVCSVTNVKPERFENWLEADVALELNGLSDVWKEKVNFVVVRRTNQSLSPSPTRLPGS